MLMPSIFGENLFDDFFTPFYYDDKDEKKAEKKLYGRRAQNLLKTDIKEKPEGYELIVDVPGFKKDEVKVALKDGYLTVSAAKGLDEDDEDKKGHYIRRERYAGACQRSYYVGEVKESDISAKYDNGVLKLTVPKCEDKLPEIKRIRIE